MKGHTCHFRDDQRNKKLIVGLVNEFSIFEVILLTMIFFKMTNFS